MSQKQSKVTRSLLKTVVAPHPKEALPVWVVCLVILGGMCVGDAIGKPVASFIVQKLSTK